MTMLEKIRKHDLFPLLLLGLSFTVYGLLIPFLGFYWDDFPYLWFRHVSGVPGVMQAIALDRPLLAVFYGLPMSIFGETPWVWQIAAVFTRWLFTLSCFKLLLALWPEKKDEMKLVTLLVLVFPGFSQQWISVIYTHVFIVLALYFYSLALFVNQVRASRFQGFAFIPPILLSIVCMTAVEYVAGLELLRPFMIFYILNENQGGNLRNLKGKLGRTLRLWLPYLAAFILFLIYRVFIASSVLYKFQQMDSITGSPWRALAGLIARQFSNLHASTLPVWGQVFKPFFDFNFSTIFCKLYIAAFILFFAGMFFISSKLSQSRASGKKWITPLVIGSLLSLLAAGLPFWAANLSPSINFPSDRVLLPFMLGSSALLFSLLFLLGSNKVLFRVLFSLIFTLAATFQLYQANQFRADWDYFSQYMRQLSWRIPSLQDNTLLVAEKLPLRFYSDNSLTAAFNWVFNVDSPGDNADLPYLINYTESRLGYSLSSLEPGTEINHNYRILNFKGSTDRMILFYVHTPGCVHIVDPRLDGENPLLPTVLRDYASSSRVDLIEEDFKQNDAFFLSGDSENSWCYYYQKASLAASKGKWQEIVSLAETAFTLDDHPNDASERFPFIEAYARTGDWNRAVQLSRDTAQISELYQPMLCKLWNILNEEISGDAKNEAMAQISKEIGCILY